MGLFNASQMSQIKAAAARSTEELKPQSKGNPRSMNDELMKSSKKVEEYFSDSHAILIESLSQLHDYVDRCIEVGYAGIDTETTGTDRIRDHIVGASLYTPGQDECYFPMKHIVPIIDVPYKNQLTYQEVGREIQRLVDNNVKLILANADFDIAMIYKDLKVDIVPAFYYDVILAWRCLKEDERDNTLKGLYAKYVKHGKVDPMKFTDFFSPKLFPFSNPKVAALYAGNDAKITYELFLWQLPYVTKTHEKCKKHHLEKIADLVWNIEFPMVAVCANLHRRGVYLDTTLIPQLHDRYAEKLTQSRHELAGRIDELIAERDIAINRSRPFRSGGDFNSNSPTHVKYLLNKLLGVESEKTGKEVLEGIDDSSASGILKVRQGVKLLGTYIDKMPNVAGPDNRIHCEFKSVGADTGRMCIAKGTPITALNGTKNIEDIVPGDLVYCYDETGDLKVSQVKNLWLTGKDKECVDVTWQRSDSEDIGHLICTPEHRILKKDGTWCRADELKCDDKLVSLRQEDNPSFNPAVQSVTPAGKFDVYDIEVETYHNFIASEICVHNSSADPNLQNIPSKMHDIRHMFRATPSLDEVIDVVDNELTLMNSDSLPVEGKGYIKASEISSGDIIETEDEVSAIVTSVEPIDQYNVRITLEERRAS